jgi:hypothetical protein
MMTFYVAIYSLAAVALIVASLMRWPRLDEEHSRRERRKRPN